MDFNYDAMRFWMDITVVIFLILNTAYTWISNRHKVNKSAIEHVDKAVSVLVGRVSLIEDKMQTAPTHEDLGKLYERINSVSNQLENVTGTLGAMTSQLTLINDHLINGGKR